MRAGRERRHRLRRVAEFAAQFTTAPMARLLHRALQPLADFHLPRGAGAAASALLIGGSLVYGTVAGGHVSDINEQIAALRDAAANAAGFNIASIALTGEKQVSREDVLTAAGITGRTSLLFLAADSARRRLKANPWIADATVLKLYPDRLQIGIIERQAFALWQNDGEELQQVGAQHVPVVVVVLLALVAADDEPANALVRQEGLVHGQIGQIRFDGYAFLRIQRLSRLDRIERR